MMDKLLKMKLDHLKDYDVKVPVSEATLELQRSVRAPVPRNILPMCSLSLSRTMSHARLSHCRTSHVSLCAWSLHRLQCRCVERMARKEEEKKKTV